MPGVEFAGFAGLQAESARAFPAFVEDQPGEVVGQVAKGQFRFGTGQTDCADKQPEPVLLMGEDMFDMGPDRRFGSVGLSIGVQSGPPIGVQKGPPCSCGDWLMLGACFALLAA